MKKQGKSLQHFWAGRQAGPEKHGIVPAETGRLAAKIRLHTHALLAAEKQSAGNIALYR